MQFSKITPINIRKNPGLYSTFLPSYLIPFHFTFLLYFNIRPSYKKKGPVSSVCPLYCQNMTLKQSNHGKSGRIESVYRNMIVSNFRPCQLKGGKEQKQEIIFKLSSQLNAAECVGA